MSRVNKEPIDLKEAMALSEDFRGVLHRLFRVLRRESPDLGASPLQMLLLAAIKEHPGIGVAELARLERLRGPTISGHVKAMEAQGIVERAPPRQEDRRRVGLVVSRKGMAIFDAIKRSRTDWLARKLVELTPQDRAAIRKAIAPLMELVR